MARISYVKLVKLVMLDQESQDIYVIMVRLVRLDKSYELDQVSYDSYVGLVKVEIWLGQFVRFGQSGQVRLVMLCYFMLDMLPGVPE